jgi:hypothetical protein
VQRCTIRTGPPRVSSSSCARSLPIGSRGRARTWWNQGWIWASLGLFILISVTMTFLGSRPLNRIRRLVHANNPSRSETTSNSSLDTFEEKQLAVLLAATHPWLLTVIGGGGFVLILWLMMFKPF